MNRNRQETILRVLMVPTAMVAACFALQSFGVLMPGWMTASMAIALVVVWVLLLRSPAAPSTEAAEAKARLEAMREAQVWAHDFTRREFVKRLDAERRRDRARADQGKCGMRRHGSSELVPEPVKAGEHPAARGE